MGKILYIVGIDGSEYSQRAAERAINLAQKVNAEVYFLAVVQWSKYQPLYVADFEAPPRDTSKEEELERKNLLEPLEKKFESSGVKIRSKLIWGLAEDVIKEQAKTEHANMIFVGRRGRSKILNLIIGSVSTSLAHSAGIPVVLVP